MHFIIPLLILLVAYPKIDKRLAIGLAFLTFVPDLDFFIDFTHRFLFHNIFFALILSLIIYFFSRNLKVFLISLYYLTSHLILDLTMGSIALFWPLYQRLIEITISLDTRWGFVFNIKTLPLKTVEDYMISQPSYFFTKVGAIVLLLFVVMLIMNRRELIKFFKK